MNLKKESILQPPSDTRISKFELFHKVKLPESFIRFIKSSNGAIPDELVVLVNAQERLIERFLCLLDDPRTEVIKGQYEIGVVIANIEDRLTDDEDQIGASIIPFAVLFGGDFLCMDFRTNSTSPSIVLWDHEESDELDPVTYEVAASFGSFLESI